MSRCRAIFDLFFREETTRCSPHRRLACSCNRGTDLEARGDAIMMDAMAPDESSTDRWMGGRSGLARVACSGPVPCSVGQEREPLSTPNTPRCHYCGGN